MMPPRTHVDRDRQGQQGAGSPRGTFSQAEFTAERCATNVSPATNEHEQEHRRQVADGGIAALLPVVRATS
jgi:hypothetical protein